MVLILDSTLNITEAFELLVESLGDEMNFINDTGAQAFKSGNYLRVDELRQRVNAINSLREKIQVLREEWGQMVIQQKVLQPEDVSTDNEILPQKEQMIPKQNSQQEEDDEIIHRRNLGRLKQGVRTPNAAFRIPILTAMIALGGRARVDDVLAKVEQLMAGKLSDIDYQMLPSGNDIRWRNSAQWTRYTLTKRGELRRDSPHGIWEITEEGRKRLEEK